jgi:hypothetical protein
MARRGIEETLPSVGSGEGTGASRDPRDVEEDDQALLETSPASGLPHTAG